MMRTVKDLLDGQTNPNALQSKLNELEILTPEVLIL